VRRKWLLIPFIAIPMAFVLSIAIRRHEAPKALSYGVYWWHLSSSPDPEGLGILSSRGVKELFIRVAELKEGGDGRFLRVSPPLSKAIKALGMKVHMVIGLADSFRRSEMDPKELGDFIVRVISDYGDAFKGMGIKVEGIQMDLEGKDLDLADYIDLLDRIKGSLDGYRISIAIPYYWMDNPLIMPLAERADFLVPMMYDYMMGRTISEPLRVTDLGWIRDFTKKISRLKKPFYAAMPTYSYSSLYDPSGRLSIPWARIPLEDGMRSKAFKEIYRDGKEVGLMASSDVRIKGLRIPKGSALRFDIIDGRRLRECISEVRRHGGKWLKGLVFFRLGSKGEDLVMGADEIARVLDDIRGVR
jgi:hypothetical protein